MSRTAILGSNALATAVQFYAAALDEATRRADQAEALLKQAMEHPPRPLNNDDDTFIALVYSTMSDGSGLEAKIQSVRNAMKHRDDRRLRRAPPGSPTIDRNLVTADDAPRRGEVRDADVPR